MGAGFDRRVQLVGNSPSTEFVSRREGPNQPPIVGFNYAVHVSRRNDLFRRCGPIQTATDKAYHRPLKRATVRNGSTAACRDST